MFLVLTGFFCMSCGIWVAESWVEWRGSSRKGPKYTVYQCISGHISAWRWSTIGS